MAEARTATSEAPKRPAPTITPENAEYWKAAREGRLLLGTCSECNKLCHPPQSVCPFCWSSKVGTKAASGRGKVNAFTLVHQSGIPAFRARLPYVIAYVELEEGVSLISNIIHCDAKSVRIDMPVKAVFETISEEAGAVLFEPA